VILTIGTVIVFGIAFLILRYFSSHPETAVNSNPMANREQSKPAGPHIEEHPAAEIQDLRIKENQVLGSYGWADRKTGAVRIPIDRAMDTVLQRGLPIRKETATK
jgi:hypothetical protein